MICSSFAHRVSAAIVFGALAAGTFAATAAAQVFTSGNLVVSRSVYAGSADTLTVGTTVLPPGCDSTTATASGTPCVTAVADGSYPYVFNNVLSTATVNGDASFGITSPLFLDEMNTSGSVIQTLEVPNSTMVGITSDSDQLVTSFSSKSEGALNLSTDGNYLVFMDYVAPVNTIDASNSNTPGVIDPTNPVPATYYRAVATVNAQGQFTFTETNAYSGNNGRAAIWVNTDGNNLFYTTGNAGNGANPEPQGVVEGAGAQMVTPVDEPEYLQNPGQPMPVGSFSVLELSSKNTKDKVGKDDNFRGMTLFNNVLYFTKGSGSNGVNTVYFIDTTGTACPKGVGVPVPGAALPTTQLAYNATTGLTNNMCVLSGFPTVSPKSGTPVEPTTGSPGINANSEIYPFGIWFANATTLYVADEGDGTATYNSTSNLYTAAAGYPVSGIQKWILNTTTNTWQYAYTLQNGLNLGVPYTVAGYPTGNNPDTGLPWAPATDGLRNIVGQVTGNALRGYSAVIYAISSTVSGDGDQGADPNKLYVITDKLSNTTAAEAANEKFTELRDAQYGEVLRGISFTPGTPVTSY